MKARRLISVSMVLGLLAAVICGWLAVRLRLKNELWFGNRTNQEVVSVKVELGWQTVEFGPVRPGEVITVSLPIGASGYYYVTVVYADGSVGGANGGSPDSGRMFGQRIVWIARDPREGSGNGPPPFAGSKAGDERTVAGLKLCWCPPGKFTMGSPPTEPERRPGEDQVEVTLTRGFWMAKYETTQGQWKRVVGKLPGELTAELPEGDDYPVGNVNFPESEAFCRKFTEQARKAGELPKDWEFRLPTEAQWEYACRAGTTTATSFGDKLSSKHANFQGKPYNGADEGPSLKRAAKVGSYPANAWGLHDMHGNTWEWCRDWYHTKLPGGMDPDLHDAPAKSRVRRGGGWTDDGWPCRSAFRLRFEPDRRYDHIGFRVVAVRP